VREDPLFAGLPAVSAVPHSRRNGLAEDDLAAHGYQVLSRVPYGDADLFTRRERGLMVFLQGRPEFDADTLGREFLHDTSRFLRRECAERPAMPENYFDRATEEMLHDLAGDALDAAALPRYAEIVAGALPLHSWQGASVRLFANWLTLVAAEKARRAVLSKTPRKRVPA
jgi:homoserine trans-succinylase